MIGFLKYFWCEVKDLFSCAEKWYEKIILYLYLSGFIGCPPVFVWMAITAEEMIFKILSIVCIILTTALWTLLIAFMVFEYIDFKDVNKELAEKIPNETNL